MPTPLAIVKERFETKDKLVEAVKKLMTEELWLPRLSEDRGGSKDIARVSNAKLLRLHHVLSEVKKSFGSRDKLIDAILEVENRSKDADYKKRLGKFSAPQLLDQYESSKRRGGYRGKKSARPAAKKAGAKKAATKKAATKKAATKKAAPKKAGTKKAGAKKTARKAKR